jgi:fatty-acyl-CoA synthase
MAVTYFDWLTHHARRAADKVAFVDLHTGRASTYGQAEQRAIRLANWLRSVGVKRGDRVAILAMNNPIFFELQFACGKIGAIMLPLNWRLAVPELEYIIGDAAPKVLIHDVGFAAQAEEIRKRCKVEHLLTLDVDRPDNDYEQALAAQGSAIVPETLTHDDYAMIMYTSGTTGHPKGAITTHGMNFYNCVNLGNPAMVTQRAKHLAILPLFHTGGLNCYANPVLHAGGTVAIMRAFDPGKCLELMDDAAFGLTHFFGVPANYLFMMQHPKFQSADFSRLTIAGVGGAPCALPILNGWAARGVALQQGYGMTETSPTVLVLDAKDAIRKVGSTGLPALHTEVRIVDEAGQDVSAGRMGELWVRGPNITPGYWNKPEATAKAFTEGWLHTGDAAKMDEDGFYYIVDRTKDMYISGGENVYPAEVETVVYQLPQIGECAVIGIPSERWGEVGMVVATLKPGTKLTEQEIIGHCVANLAKFKVPQSVAFIEALPRNATGKVLKRELRVTFVGADKPAIS